jgi:hypothetical protein
VVLRSSRHRAAGARFKFLVFSLLVLAAGLLGHVEPAVAATALTVTPVAPLALLGAPVGLAVKGSLAAPDPSLAVSVEVRGPGTLPAGTKEWPLASTFAQTVDATSTSLEASIVLPPETFKSPGAYRVTLKLTPAAGKSQTASLWLGVVASPPGEVDLAFVFSLTLGVHRDPSGIFVDEEVQDSVVPRTGGSSGVQALLGLADQHPDWNFTLALDPAYLDQVRDLSDGYMQSLSAGPPTKVDSASPTAIGATETVNILKSIAASESVQVIPTPYAMAALTLLASERWDDGVGQMRVAKAALVQGLSMAGIPDGAYAPHLDLTTGCIRYFGQASIDYVVASSNVTKDLAEEPQDPLQPIRLQDIEGNRVSLLPVSPRLQAAVGPPWDTTLFWAALAGELASGSPGPFVVAPATDYDLAPAAYLQQLGDELAKLPWLHTLTLKQLVQSHPPSSRPVFLSRYAAPLDDFVAQGLMEGLRTAHSAFTDLEVAADPQALPVGAARLLLYVAESGYWFDRGASPEVANLGLAYQDAVKAQVRSEFDKVRVAPGATAALRDGQGEVQVGISNGTGYTLKLDVDLSGQGLTVQGGSTRTVQLGPGDSSVAYEVKLDRPAATAVVTAKSGATLVATGSVALRSVSSSRAILWVAGGAALILAALGFAVLWMRRKPPGRHSRSRAAPS